MQPVNVFQNPQVVTQTVPTPPVYAPPPPVVPVYPESQGLAQQAYQGGGMPKKRRKPSHPPPAPPVTTLLVTEDLIGPLGGHSDMGVIGGKLQLFFNEISSGVWSSRLNIPGIFCRKWNRITANSCISRDIP